MQAIEAFIEAKARYASRVCAGSYDDFDDLVQIGKITRWRIEKERCDIGYLRQAIRHEIMNAAIASYYPVTANPKIKKLAMRVSSLLAGGISRQEIMEQLNINQMKMRMLCCLIAPVKRQHAA